MANPFRLITRIDARDRALYSHWALGAGCPATLRRFWLGVTHAGGAVATIMATAVPLFLGGPVAAAARLALATLVLSHLTVQVLKRGIGRPRPSAIGAITLAADPDRFSFPSGHSAAAMSVAFGYAMAFPALAGPLVAVATLVGMSRVFLGVHYPGDVAVGQLIAVVTGMLLVG